MVELYVSTVTGSVNQKVSTMLGNNEVESFTWSSDGTRLVYSTAPLSSGRADALYVAEPGETPLALDDLVDGIGKVEYAP